ncbi:MAG TPA: heavy metal translocating P-type ATPase [Gammaproteobacteria bacterium]|nr:heavy metal translocating P-type ATPase [Gammaproteobacteria bacterium]
METANLFKTTDPVCGMEVDPTTAAGYSDHKGTRYHFCSPVCKHKFDTAPKNYADVSSGRNRSLSAKGADLCNAAESTANHSHSHHACAPHIAPDAIESRQTSQSMEYDTIMRKFWFAALIGVLVLLLMLLELIPSLLEATMQWRQTIGIVAAILTFPVLAWSGSQFFVGAWNNFRNHNTNMDTLVALGTGAAWLYSTLVAIAPGLFPKGTAGMYFDVAVIVIALIILGQALELRAKGRSSAAIQKLLELQAKTARVIRDGKEIDIPVKEVIAGDTVLVRPGEKIAVDGVILEGESVIDESVVTGESVPVDKKPGDSVIGASMNKTGAFTFRATRVGKDTALARIVEMVQQAQSSKPPIGRLVDVISSYFVPSVMIVAVLTFLAWFNFGPAPVLNFAIITMVAVLVIACPCALGLATPISLMVGVGKAAEHGVLIRNGEALETAARLTTIVLDKTGTITKGRPELTDLLSLTNLTEDELLNLAAVADRRSEHPLAQAIVQAARERGVEIGEPRSFNAVPGHGVEATVDKRRVLVGNRKLMQRENIVMTAFEAEASRLADEGKTPMFVALDNQPTGIIAVADTIKEDSIAAVRALQKMGIEVVMITGDNERTARAIARQSGIGRVLAEVLPEEKAQELENLQAQDRSRKVSDGRGMTRVGMVGDGVNDAPALAQADVGFAIGTGADVAIEAADVTLVGGSLRGVVYAIEISRGTLHNIKQNLFGAFIYNVVGIPVAAGVLYPLFGALLSPIVAGAAMAASSITVVTNANRLRFFEPQPMKEASST